jgi:hypothetical protein
MNQKEIASMIKSLERSQRFMNSYLKKGKLVSCKCGNLVKHINGNDDICDMCLKANPATRISFKS